MAKRRRRKIHLGSPERDHVLNFKHNLDALQTAVNKLRRETTCGNRIRGVADSYRWLGEMQAELNSIAESNPAARRELDRADDLRHDIATALVETVRVCTRKDDRS